MYAMVTQCNYGKLPCYHVNLGYYRKIIHKWTMASIAVLNYRRVWYITLCSTIYTYCWIEVEWTKP